jgi:UDP:flavonoid glycosyltransferase YjiC (YdhE family)
LKPKKILFLPSDAGSGQGHVTRCIALAHLLKKQQYQPHFILSSDRSIRRVQHLYPAEEIKFPKNATPLWSKVKSIFQHGSPDIYHYFYGLEFQFIRDGIMDAGSFSAMLRSYLKFVKSIEPDLLIADNHLFAYSLSQILQIPIIQIVRNINHPNYGELIWWENADERVKPPQVIDYINESLQEFKLSPIREVKELLLGDWYLIPSIPEIENIDPSDPKTLHLGPLLVKQKKSFSDAYQILEFRENRRKVFMTLGGASHKYFNDQLREMIINISHKMGINVIIANPFMKKGTENLVTGHIKMYPWVPGQFVIKHTDSTMFHGGYSTFMELLSEGKPGLVIPTHIEQEGNARRLKQLGCGDYLLPYNASKLVPVKRKFATGHYQYLVGKEFETKIRVFS